MECDQIFAHYVHDLYYNHAPPSTPPIPPAQFFPMSMLLVGCTYELNLNTYNQVSVVSAADSGTCDRAIDPTNQNQYIVWGIGALGETAFQHHTRASGKYKCVRIMSCGV